ncbi:MAG: potassium channel family protein [Gemmatimonadota bacterium]
MTSISLFTRRFIGTLIVFAALTVLGTAGYIIIEDANVWDAVYMTVITLTAVGYDEVIPLTPAGRTYTMVLLLAGLTWMGVWFALTTSLIVELDLKDVLRRRRIMSRIEKMKDHVIVCGAGRTGRQVAQELDSMQSPYVLIERDPNNIGAVLEFLPDAVILEGDATHDHVLLEAGLLRARGLVTCLSADTDNLFVCLSARDLAAKVKIVARAYEEETMDKLYRAGADQVVSPNVSSAIRMASVVLRPSVVSFLDIATRSSDLSLRLEQVSVSPEAPVAGQTLAEARIPQRTGFIVIAIRKKERVGHEFLFNPVADTRLEPGDEVIVLGQTEQIEKLRSLVE